MGRITDVYDAGRVAAIGNEIAEAIDLAAVGSLAWSEVPRVIGEALPGSMTGLCNENFAAGKVNYAATHNLDPDFLSSYQSHFSQINPWADFWYSAGSGQALVAEEICPTRLFARTEFYNDWLRPQGDIEAAVGIKIDGGNGDLIRITAHYPLALAGKYDRPAVEILRRIRGNLRRAVDLQRLLGSQSEPAIAAAALLERDGLAAFVVDQNRCLRQANQKALDLFSSGSGVAARNGTVSLTDQRADSVFRAGVARLAQGSPTDMSRVHVRNGTGEWQISLIALPGVSISAEPTLFRPRSMVLVLVRDLARHPAGDLSHLSRRFGLTPAEIALCERLVGGVSLAEAAVNVGLSLETVRNRCKSIFQKTGTHRQGELVAMLAGISARPNGSA